MTWQLGNKYEAQLSPKNYAIFIYCSPVTATNFPQIYEENKRRDWNNVNR